MSKILVVDDHAIVRRGISEILARAHENFTCKEAKDATEALAQIRAQTWDLLILDLGLPGRSGIDVLKDVRLLAPQLPVLMLSMYPEDQYGRRVIKAGARGYMNKESAPDELIGATHRLLAGGRYVSPALAEKLAQDLQECDDLPSHEALSDRELEVLRLIAKGRTVSKIAEDMHLAVTTVSSYRTRILKKLHKTSTADLIRYALENNLVDLNTRHATITTNWQGAEQMAQPATFANTVVKTTEFAS